MNRKSFVAGIKALSAAVSSNLPADLAFYAVQQIVQHGNKTELAELLLALSTDKGRRLGTTGCLVLKYILFQVDGLAIHKKASKASKARQAETIAFREAANGDNAVKTMARNISVTENFGIKEGRLNAEGTAFCIGWQQFALVEKPAKAPAAAKPATAASMLTRINGVIDSLRHGLTCSSREELAQLTASLVNLQLLAEKAGNRYLQQVQTTVTPAAPAADPAPAAAPAADPAPAAPAAAKALIGTAAVKREKVKRAAVAKRNAAAAEKVAAAKAAKVEAAKAAKAAAAANPPAPKVKRIAPAVGQRIDSNGQEVA